MYDPCCGTGGFLAQAAQYLQEKIKKNEEGETKEGSTKDGEEKEGEEGKSKEGDGDKKGEKQPAGETKS